MPSTDVQRGPDEPLEIRRIYGPYGIFTSGARRPVVFAGEDYLTAAHAITAAKVTDPALAARIRMAPNPREARKLARPSTVRPDWPQTGRDVIRRVHRARMIQHPGLAATLRATGRRPLLVTDAITDGNEVGQALEEVRDELGKPADPAIAHAQTLIPGVISDWRWVLFGTDLVVAMRTCSVTMPASTAFKLLRRIAETTLPAIHHPPDLTRWRVPGAAVLLHHPGQPAPASSTHLATLVPTAEVTYVHWPDITPVAPDGR
ncbi:NADAR family protein [Catenuloplanes japonicus]|uniref:NADAR family protein n=1 Tax=Catenuloplanes japonicus TaxID=33876 RepID=UPI00068AE5B7|nr:NADAR family protein [Catenuloplanes japonicus]